MSENYYRHSGQHFDVEIASELLFTKYIDQVVYQNDIEKELFEYHQNGGGLPPVNRFRINREKIMCPTQLNFYEIDEDYELRRIVCRIVCRGLQRLERNNCATRVRGTTWRIHNKPDKKPEPKIIGFGDEFIYVFYYPAEKDRMDLAVPVWESNGDIKYPCNIGSTVRDVETRVGEKTKDSSEPPVIALTIRTDTGKQLEKIIHDILAYNGRQCENATRTDWFKTTPKEVEDIYDSVSL